MPDSVKDLDLSPKKGKTYWRNCHREWREEFIYFLLVDRFHDNLPRVPDSTPGMQKGFGTEEQLKNTCGGTLKGITNHLSYIKELGCTALWLSPIFENNSSSYHGYAIQNYLEIDPRFGTKDDLENLVDTAHKMDMRVFLDIVLHHSGDNWAYPDDHEYYYYQGVVFPFGSWRSKTFPIPAELRNPELYWRKGQIRNFDSYPEYREGDFYSMKTFKNDSSPEAVYLQDILEKVHCYWLRETDFDGCRIDAVKHMSGRAVSQFCSHMREYAYKLGKLNFFIFGELVGPDEMYNHYIGPKTAIKSDDKAIYYGLNSVLDFPLYHVLPEVIKGHATPGKLIQRYESLRQSALNRGEFGEFLVTFLDNHDQVGQPYKKRFASGATEQQVIAGVGFLLCALGTPCIYYGTEQGLSGEGQGDWCIRESMFDLDGSEKNILNPKSRIYMAIRELSELRKKSPVLKFGRMYIREFSDNGLDFHWPVVKGCLIAFSRVLYDEEMIIAFNTSLESDDEEYVTVDSSINTEGSLFQFIYGGEKKLTVLKAEEGTRHFIKLRLSPGQFVVLTNTFEEKPRLHPE